MDFCVWPQTCGERNKTKDRVLDNLSRTLVLLTSHPPDRNTSLDLLQHGRDRKVIRWISPVVVSAIDIGGQHVVVVRSENPVNPTAACLPLEAIEGAFLVLSLRMNESSRIAQQLR